MLYVGIAVVVIVLLAGAGFGVWWCCLRESSKIQKKLDAGLKAFKALAAKKEGEKDTQGGIEFTRVDAGAGGEIEKNKGKI